MESREELIVDVQCRLVDIGIVVRSKKMKIFLETGDSRTNIADEKEDLKIDNQQHKSSPNAMASSKSFKLPPS